MKIVMINAIWCSGCIVMKKVWKKVLENYNLDITYLDYDFDDISTYNVGNILPVAIIYKDGIEINRIIGENTYEEVVRVLEALK